MSDENDKPEEAKLVVDEKQDGSVTVEGIELPADEAAEEQKAPEQKLAEGGVVPEDGGDDHPDDTEAIRAIRREKRKAKKQFHREQQREKDYRLQQLQRQNQELLARLQAVEQRTHGSEVARIDKAIEDQQLRIQYAKMKIAEATQAQDGDAMANAQDMLYEARRTAEQLESLKKQASTPQTAAPTAPDKAVQRMAASWMERNSWYDPSGNDEDSEIALTIDKRMAREGWDPRSPEYWDELDARLQKRLPHRYSESAPEERELVRKPKSVVTSSGRESVSSSNGRGTFTLSPEQVRAMKDAGMWEDPVLRNKMIKRYANEARNNRSN